MGPRDCLSRIVSPSDHAAKIVAQAYGGGRRDRAALLALRAPLSRASCCLPSARASEVRLLRAPGRGEPGPARRQLHRRSGRDRRVGRAQRSAQVDAGAIARALRRPAGRDRAPRRHRPARRQPALVARARRPAAAEHDAARRDVARGDRAGPPRGDGRRGPRRGPLRRNPRRPAGAARRPRHADRARRRPSPRRPRRAARR